MAFLFGKSSNETGELEDQTKKLFADAINAGEIILLWEDPDTDGCKCRCRLYGILTIDGISYRLQKIDTKQMITGKHYVFYGISWYELIPASIRPPPTAKAQMQLLMRCCTYTANNMTEYLHWSIKALVPYTPGLADKELEANKKEICGTATELLELIDYVPDKIYRGIVMEKPQSIIVPHKNFKYLSFSEDLAMATHFADPINGFGQGIIDIKTTLGEYGYIIEYTPVIKEVLFHWKFLNILPYREAFNAMGLDADAEIKGLLKQKEITILQPISPFTNIINFKPKTNETTAA